MRVVFMGTPAFAVPSLERLAAGGHALPLVVTRPDRPRRHGASKPEATPVKECARALGLDVAEPENLRGPAVLEMLASVRPEVVVVVAFGQILPEAVLGVPARGAVNVHASLLPRWRGAAPIARAILAGDTVTGVTTMQMERGLDTGPILLERRCDIGPDETAGELTVRLAGLGADLLIETLDGLERGTVTPLGQDESRATWAAPLRREDGRIDWNDEAAAIAARVRACRPWPVAEAGLRDGRVQILAAAPLRPGAGASVAAPARDAAAPEPGTVLETGETLVVACGGGTRLGIRSLRIPGRRAVTAREAVNGRLIASGDRLSAPA
ncbi:MAG TPA: methionyl-tRNA formyltransferase [Candidatus Polarisedimenticolia bacterium]|jgi:methionyl-tRNA formyltransferase|nr:methionyl-tRNA formyltransferase [Candidatus Polarisedimenticolia bacterium]